MPETIDRPVTALRPLAGTYLDGLETLEARSGGAVAGPLELVRAWPRGPGRLTLEYRDADGDLLGAQWYADDAEHELAGRRIPGSVQACAANGRPVLLQPRGADRRLPGLAPLLERPAAQLLVHRAERRGVVRLRTSGGDRYAKAVRLERLGDLADASGRAATLVAGTPLAVPQPLEIDEAGGVVHFGALPGEALHDRLAEPAAAAAAGAALRALHDRPPPPGLPVHDADAEAAVILSWINRLFGAMPSPGRGPAISPARSAALRAAALAPGIAAAILQGPPSPPVPVHRDLHDKQVLLDDNRVALLDCDTLARGEAALDLANLVVHLELRGLQGRCTGAEARAAADAALGAYAPSAATACRLPAYAAATRLRLACVYALRPTRPGLVLDLLDLVPLR